MSIVFAWQEPTEELYLWTDSDWANSRTDRKSCSGGVVMLGRHVLHFWSRIQDRIAPSSGVAELYSANRGLSTYGGTVHLYREMFKKDFAEGCLCHHLDASATRGMILRRGVGDIKHLEVRDLWCQEITRTLRIDVMKVHRSENVSDLLASATVRADIDKFLDMLNVRVRQ